MYKHSHEILKIDRDYGRPLDGRRARIKVIARLRRVKEKASRFSAGRMSTEVRRECPSLKDRGA